MRLVPTAIARGVGRQALVAQKHSPSILFGVGVVGMIGSTVLACRATLKVEEVLEKTKKDVEETKKKIEIVESMEHRDYSEQDRKQDIAVVYTKGVVNLAKLYGPSILLGAASIACLTKSHNILAQRNAALTAAYIAVDEAFKKYRSRVVEEYGEDKDRELMYSSEPVEIVSEKGNITYSRRVDENAPSMYARFFDQLSPEWSPEPEYNLVYLKHQQSYFNHMLKARGHVFLNEVYDQLGIERTKEGSVVGWILAEKGTDNYIDFGLYEDNPRARDFVNGREGAILLDFNVDGLIYDKINDPKKIKWQS